MEQQNNTGVMFKNKNKQKPNQPDYRGTITINNKKMAIAGWIKLSKPKFNPDGTETEGEKYQFVMISELQQKQQLGNSQEKKPETGQKNDVTGYTSESQEEVSDEEVPF
jgi:hypothetical protein